MLVLALLIVSALFALLFVGRVGGARRAQILARLPSVLLAAAAIFTLARGGLWPGLALALGACVLWQLGPNFWRRAPQIPPVDSPEDAQARVILGVGATASEREIRAAYRTKMTQAHPDRGGSHAEAARLTAARDRLLRKGR